MADTAKRFTVTNTAAGPRGLYDADAGYVEVPAGQSVTLDLTDAEQKSAERSGHFEFGEKAAAAAKATATGTATADLPHNVPKLKKIARDEGIDVGEARTVDQLTAAITAGRAAKAGAGGGIPPVQPSDDLDAMDDATLRTTVQAITGKEPPADADRDTLLKLARGVE